MILVILSHSGQMCPRGTGICGSAQEGNCGAVVDSRLHDHTGLNTLRFLLHKVGIKKSRLRKYQNCSLLLLRVGSTHLYFCCTKYAYSLYELESSGCHFS